MMGERIAAESLAVGPSIFIGSSSCPMEPKASASGATFTSTPIYDDIVTYETVLLYCSRRKVAWSASTSALIPVLRIAHAVVSDLHGEEDQEGHHQGEETRGLGEGETQNGVGEQLSAEGRVARDTGDEGAEHRADTGSGTDELPGTQDGGTDGDGLGDDAARLATCDVGGGVAEHGAAHEQAGVDGLEAGDGGCWAW